MTERASATTHTVAANNRLSDRLPWADDSDFERARKGLIAQHDGPILNERPGGLVGVSWDTANFAFIHGDAPASVNPSLWRQAKLNAEHGLYEVREGVYQVRGYDTAVVSFIATNTGWLVIESTSSASTTGRAS